MTRRTPSPRLALVALVAALANLSASAPAGAQPDAASRASEVRRLVDQLGADTFSSREAATRALAEMRVGPADLSAAGVEIASLSAEQRARLESALFEQFASTSRAGLGVQFDGAFASGVRLSRVIPEFPAAAVLMPGDVVERADGAPLTLTGVGTQPWLPLRYRILSHDPGETMPMVIRRGGRRLTVDVPLGRYEDLGNAQPVSDRDLAAAWSYRLQRMGLTLRDAGRLAATPTADGQSVWVPMPNADQTGLRPETGLIPGGRGGNRAPRRRAELAGAGRATSTQIVLRPGQAQVRVIQPQAVPQNMSRASLVRQIEQVSAWLDAAVAAASDPGLSPHDRADAADRVVQARERLAQLQRQLALIDER
ncbi:MAG: hypothetical protein D6693_08450 [Planctomycetota bacterium]|nr:MAG: hypothetical protein D6693_08450 [Planctomycetota bacterium]